MADRGICAVDGCGKVALNRGWCSKHYQRWRKHGNPSVCLRSPRGPCVIGGCERLARAHGLCGTHYQRKLRHGSPHANPAPRYHGCEVEGCERAHKARGLCVLHYNRKLRGVELGGPELTRAQSGEPMAWIRAHATYQGDDCLPWPYGTDRNGYGMVHDAPRKRVASRVMAEIVHGPAPSDSHHAAHSCGQGQNGCMNPNHLRWATPFENSMDRIEHGTFFLGEQCPPSKLTEYDVRQIRQRARSEPQHSIAKDFPVNVSTIGKIVRRERWAWLED